MSDDIPQTYPTPAPAPAPVAPSVPSQTTPDLSALVAQVAALEERLTHAEGFIAHFLPPRY